MYESPINLYVQEIMSKMENERENAIMAKISGSMGVDIDKGELIKALQYDRQQYNKGYADAKAEYESMLDKIRAEIEQAADKQFQIAMGVSDLNERYAHIQMENAYRHCLNIIDKYRGEKNENS